MTPDPSTATGRPRIDENDETDATRSAYLGALGELTRHHAHQLRARVGTVALQLDLARELLAGNLEPDRDRAREQVAKARSNLRDVVDALEAFFATTRPIGDDGTPGDLGVLVRGIEAALAPVARDRMIELHVSAPEEPVLVAGGLGALRSRLLVDALQSLAALPPGSRLEVAVASAGDEATVSLTNFRATTETAAAAVESNGPRASAEPRDDSPLVLTVRTHHESR